MQNYSQILVNPDSFELFDAINYALDIVQESATIRKVKFADNPLYEYEKVFQAKEGILQKNGGQPSRVDGGYSAGQTTRLGVVWWTDRNSNLHTKIAVDRTQVSNFSVPNIFSYVESYFHLIYPDDDPCPLCGHNIIPEEGHWRDQKFVCDPCIEQERYFAETGFYPAHRRKRLK